MTKIDIIINAGIVIAGLVTLWSVFTVNHFFVGQSLNSLLKTVAALLSRFNLSDLKMSKQIAFKSVTLRVLFLTLLSASFSHAQYLFKDEVVIVKEFDEKIEKIGQELKSKTGWSLYMIAVEDIGALTLVDFQKQFVPSFEKPYVVLALAIKQGKIEQGKMDERVGRVGIYGSKGYEDKIDKEDILRGTLYPLLGAKVKSDPRNKYITVMYNGYADIAEHIADSYDVHLESSSGNTNRTVINILKFAFYAMILGAIAIFMYQKYYTKER